MEPYNLHYLYDAYSKVTNDFVLYLPRTSDVRQLVKYHKNDQEKLKIIHYCMHGSSKALCVFYGSFELDNA
jgi:trimethylguanosine synthase